MSMSASSSRRNTALALTASALMLVAGLPGAAAATPADPDPGPAQASGSDQGEARLAELERRMQELEAELAAALRNDADAPSVTELERRLEILSREIETLRIGEAAVEADQSVYGFGPAASKVYRTERGVSIGGYGEALYQGFDSARDDGSPSGKTDELDFLRAITYIGYKFNDRIVFNSEIEFEHASTGKEGEVSVEFAYLDFLLKDAVNIRTGMVLVPLGFVNELHEPPIFLGAKRPTVERVLIPTTWRENGAGIFGDLGPVSYRAYVLAGLDGAGVRETGFTAGGIRGARQSGSKSLAEDLAFVARADWEITPGLTLGGAFYTGDSGQGAETPGGEAIGARTDILDLHLEWRWKGIQFRGLWVDLSIDDAQLINDYRCIQTVANFQEDDPCSPGSSRLQTAASAPDRSVGEEMNGYYLEAGYDLLASRETGQAVIPFLRYETFNTQDAVPDGFLSDPANDVTLMTYGVNYKPISNVVVKLEYQDFENEADTGVDQWNLAVGFLF